MTERVRCKRDGCARDILPSTAADTGGYCQGAAYSECPDCLITMLFVAQLACEEIGHGEGIFYASVSPGCRIGAVTLQQSQGKSRLSCVGALDACGHAPTGEG